MCTKNQLHILMEKLHVVRWGPRLIELYLYLLIDKRIGRCVVRLGKFPYKHGRILCATMSQHGYVGDRSYNQPVSQSVE